MMRRLRILKLGWEFPPAVNGGLGVACFGLSKALAPHVDLHVIVPMAGDAAVSEGFKLTGLDRVRLANFERIGSQHRYEEFSRIEHIPAGLDPYQIGGGEQSLVELRRMATGEARVSGKMEDLPDRFHIDELYGVDLASKVLGYSRAIVRLAALGEWDVVHAHDWMTFPAGVAVKHELGIPLVTHLHATQYDRAGPGVRDEIYEIEKSGMEEADRVIPVSCYTGRICAEHYGIDPAKIRAVHNGAEPVEPYRTEKKFPEKLVLFLGRLTAQKGPETFLEIAAKVLSRTRDVRFVMAGSGERLRKLIETGAFRGVGDSFHFTGFLDRERVNELLSMTDVYCMPSVSEPFGLSALEAAQFGIPAVISEQSGVAEVLKGALTTDYRDIDGMARHIVDLLIDDELRRKVVARAREDMKAATWDAAAGRVMEIYREVCDG